MSKSICKMDSLSGICFNDIRISLDYSWVVLDKYGNIFPIKSIDFSRNGLPSGVNNLSIASEINRERFNRKIFDIELDKWAGKTKYVLFEGGSILEVVSCLDIGNGKVKIAFHSGAKFTYSNNKVAPIMEGASIQYKNKFTPKALFDMDGSMFWYRQ